MVLVWVAMGCRLASCPVWLYWLVFLAGIGFAGVCYLVSGISFCVGLCDCVLITDYSITIQSKILVKKTLQDLKSGHARLLPPEVITAQNATKSKLQDDYRANPVHHTTGIKKTD